MADKKNVDWDLIEKEYRAGIRSLRDIGAEFDVSEALIRRKANKENWIRNLKEKISDRAQEIVFANGVRDAVRKKSIDIVEDKAEQQATVLLNEREDIKRLSGLSEKFESELAVYEEDLERKARIMKSLTETRKIIIELRRRNYGITDNANGDADKSDTVTGLIIKYA